MHIHRPLRNHIETYRKAAQDLRLWVLEVLAWWLSVLGGVFDTRSARMHLQGLIRDARRDARDLIFLAMIARMSVRRPVLAPSRPPSVRRGFRYAARRFRPARIFTRGIALKTLADIRAALDAFDAVVERALKRLPKTRVAGGRLSPSRRRDWDLCAWRCVPNSMGRTRHDYRNRTAGLWPAFW